MEKTTFSPRPFQQHAPTDESPTPLPGEFQIYDKVYLDFGSGQTVEASISGVHFHDPALYYEVLVKMITGADEERYLHLEVPAGIVFNASLISNNSSERGILERINKMCEESLPPDLFEKWEEIQNALKNTRKAFK